MNLRVSRIANTTLRRAVILGAAPFMVLWLLLITLPVTIFQRMLGATLLLWWSARLAWAGLSIEDTEANMPLDVGRVGHRYHAVIGVRRVSAVVPTTEAEFADLVVASLKETAQKLLTNLESAST